MSQSATPTRSCHRHFPRRTGDSPILWARSALPLFRSARAQNRRRADGETRPANDHPPPKEFPSDGNGESRSRLAMPKSPKRALISLSRRIFVGFTSQWTIGLPQSWCK
ncbi:hypothetical protein DAI22_02g247601 [Oryza sativa Japonica Group]|nr:hypothetical protein DAI22_02g247601 [Oryza sativa Japonica Group]